VPAPLEGGARRGAVLAGGGAAAPTALPSGRRGKIPPSNGHPARGRKMAALEPIWVAFVAVVLAGCLVLGGAGGSSPTWAPLRRVRGARWRAPSSATRSR